MDKLDFLFTNAKLSDGSKVDIRVSAVKTLPAFRSERLQIYVLWQLMVFRRQLFRGPRENWL